MAFGGRPRLNGEVLPEDRSRGAYERVVGEYRALVVPLLPESGFEAAQSWVTVREKGTRPASGPYDSAKMHLDAWSGNPPGVVVMIPVEGDIEGGGVEFFRPTRNFHLVDEPLLDYNEAPDFGPEPLGGLWPWHVHFVDCLHRTQAGGRRVSVDHRFAYRLGGAKAGNYVDFDKWIRPV